MTPTAGTFTVVVAHASSLRSPGIAEALTAFRKIPFQDAAVMARHCWGVVAEHLTAEEAEQLKLLLTARNIEARVLPDASLPPLPATEPVRQFEFSDTGFR